MRQVVSARRTKQVWLYRWTLAVLAALLALIVPAVRWAHPLGNFTINHYSSLELAPGQARVFYVLDMAEIPTFQTIQQIDRDGDKQVSAAEGAAYATAKMDELRRGLRLTFDGAPVDLRPIGAGFLLLYRALPLLRIWQP